MQRKMIATAVAVTLLALAVVHVGGRVHREDLLHKGVMPRETMPQCDSVKDTSDIIGGSTEAGIVCVTDDAGQETRMFYWEAKVPAPRGILFYLGGGPGCASSSYMLQMGPSHVLPNGTLSPNNPYALAEALNFNIFFIDAPAHVGYSWSPTPARRFNYSDSESAQVVAAAIIKIHQAFQDLPVVVAGVSYGTKSASLSAARLLAMQPDFPLRALCLDSVLLDRIAELKNWTGSFGRFLGVSAAEKLHAAGVDDMEGRAKELRDAGRDQEAADVIEEMWQTTMKLTGVKNQHYLDPDRRYLTDTQAEKTWTKTKQYVANLNSALVLDVPTFHGCSGAVWMGFEDSRLRDATWSLAEVTEKGVRVLLFSGYWDGMATVEATTAWLGTNFPGKCDFLEVDDPHFSPDTAKALASQQMVHVEVDNCGHGVSEGRIDIFEAALRTFLSDDTL